MLTKNSKIQVKFVQGSNASLTGKHIFLCQTFQCLLLGEKSLGKRSLNFPYFKVRYVRTFDVAGMTKIKLRKNDGSLASDRTRVYKHRFPEAKKPTSPLPLVDLA